MIHVEMLAHTVGQVFAVDGILMLVHPVDHVPPGLAFVGRHDVVSLADLAGDVLLSPGVGVASAVQTALAGATGKKDGACQVQLDQHVLDLDTSGLHDMHGHPELGDLPGHDVLDPLLQLGPGSAWDEH